MGEVKLFPADALTQDLYAELTAIPTVDAHEHLPPEPERLQAAHDFYSLFEHYCRADIVSAGAQPEDLAFFADRSHPAAVRWERFKPFLSAIRTGGYARSALIVVRDLLELPDLDDDTFVEAGRRLAEMNQPGLYEALLHSKCNLAACIECWRYGQGPYPDFFYHLAPSPEVVDLVNRGAVEHLAAGTDVAITGLEDALSAMDRMIQRWREDPKVIGVKSAHAYSRPIQFDRPDKGAAGRAFDRLRISAAGEGDLADVRPVQDFLMVELAAKVRDIGLPMVFHTGLQAGNRGRIQDTNPLLLESLIRQFPDLKIDLFHAGIPWTREIAVLAKYFPGVHLNLAWTHIIDPAMVRSALSEWLDLVPNTKIFGFGGDYSIPEKVWGHLKIARYNIARVLADKIREGAYSRADAAMVGRRLMLENPARFYDLA